MNLPWTWYQLTNAASGALFITLGILVLRLRSRERANAAFSLFTIAFGASFIFLDLLAQGSTLDPPRQASETMGFLGYALCTSVAIFGLVRLVLAFPVNITREERSKTAVAGTLAAAAAILFAVPYVGAVPPHAAVRAAAIAESALHGTMLGMGALFALRFPEATARERSAYAMVAAAIVLNPAFYSAIVYGFGLTGHGPTLAGYATLDAAALLGPPIIVACLWLRASARAPGGACPARNVALLSLVALLGGALAVPTATASGDHWGYGAARTAGILVLSYAIVRHQLLGIDVKLRWTISKSTIAAIFVAVFFVSSEAAQQFFGDTIGSTYAGIVAAGALVFAIAPLQKVAERLAEKAVPTTPPASAPPTRKGDASLSEASYRDALRWALRHGPVSPKEERSLLVLAERLGIPASRAFELRDEAATTATPSMKEETT